MTPLWFLLAPVAVALIVGCTNLVRAVIADWKEQSTPGPTANYYDFEVFERYW